jgi:methyl-accepting chemotaxis protein
MKTWWNNLRIQYKILIPVLALSLTSGIITYLYFSNLYRDTETNALVSKARAIVLSAEAAREYTADQIRNDVFRDAKQSNLTTDQVLKTVPIFSAMEVAKKKSSELGFTLKVPKFSPRNPDNQPDEYEAAVLKKLESGSVGETWEIDKATNKIRYFRPVKLTEECMKCHGDPARSMEYWGRNDGKDITGTRMENWRVGEVHGAFEVMMPMQPVDEAVSQKSLIIAGIAGGTSGLLVLIMLLVARFISTPLKTMEEAAQKMAVGDFNVNFGNTKAQDEVGSLARSFEQISSMFHRWNAEQKEMIRQHSAGMISYRMPDEKYGGMYAAMMRDTNDLVKAHIDVKMRVVDVISQYAVGNFSIDMDRLPGEKAKITQSIDDVKASLKGLNDELLMLVDAASKGNLSKRGNPQKFQFTFREMIESMNVMLDNIINPVNIAAANIDRLSKGDIPARIAETFNGDLNTLKNNINMLIDTLNAFNDEILMLAQAAVEGRLSTRGDAARFQAAYRDMVVGINNTLDAVINPTTEGVQVLQSMADGNMTRAMTGDYRGDHAVLKNAVNATLASINTALGQVIATAEQVLQGAKQVSSASQSLSQGATEQAASLEEISSSMQEIASQTKLNAENANQANQLAAFSRSSAERGNEDMRALIEAMNEINESSKNISRIIKVIDEIAFQTNLLALNAAVEAARAGRHGKGFAVVAEEVRNLAARSAKAAKETADMIESAVRKAENGASIAQRTGEGLKEIVSGSTKVTDIVAEIAAASNEQAQGIAQINVGLSQIDKVTQQNTASAEECAAAAEELSGQAMNLNAMLSRFQLKSGASGQIQHTVRSAAALSSPSAQRGRAAYENGSQQGNLLMPHEVIKLDDNDFGKY